MIGFVARDETETMIAQLANPPAPAARVGGVAEPEIRLLASVANARDIAQKLEISLDYLERLVEKELIAAVGKVLELIRRHDPERLAVLTQLFAARGRAAPQARK